MWVEGRGMDGMARERQKVLRGPGRRRGFSPEVGLPPAPLPSEEAPVPIAPATRPPAPGASPSPADPPAAGPAPPCAARPPLSASSCPRRRR